MEFHTKVCDSEVTGRALDQANTQTLLQGAYTPTDAGSGYTQGLGSACKATVFYHLGKDVKVIQVVHFGARWVVTATPRLDKYVQLEVFRYELSTGTRVGPQYPPQAPRYQ